MTVGELAETLARFDPTMEVRVVGHGGLVATYLAISRESAGQNVLILSAVRADDAFGLPEGPQD